jgi:apolipoprotein N-acyltransferase
MKQTNQITFHNKTGRQFLYLFTGALLIFLTHTRYGIGFFQFILPIPFLLHINETKGAKSKALLFLALFAGWTCNILKIVTEPIPWVISIFYALPIALFMFAGYLLFSRFKNSPWNIFLFPSIMMITEWCQSNLTPLSSWGHAAYTQLENPILLQSLSLFGLYGLAYVLYHTSYQLFLIITGSYTRKNIIAVLLPVTVLLLYGQCRITYYEGKNSDTILTAAIGTDSTAGAGPFPDTEVRKKVQNKLFADTASAIKSGAKIIVWTEASTAVLPEEEYDFTNTISLFSKNNLYHNGDILQTYYKHEPVPGEPCVKGTNKFSTIAFNDIQTGGAICYDYDFPYIAKVYGKLNADIVSIPASDWRGIDPIHTQMASCRGIENGHSTIRSTRFGLSAGADFLGKIHGKLSHFDSKNKVLLTTLPAKGVTTLYSIIGDTFVLICLILIIMLFITSWVFTKRNQK